MTGLRPLLKKELVEQVRTYRLLMVGGIFLLFGLVTPLLVKMLPKLVAQMGDTTTPLQLPEPTAAMAVTEYSRNMVQVGLLAAILVAMGSVSREVELGTAAMTLSKPVGRGAFVAAKLVGLSATFFVALLAAAVACYFYTAVLFEAVDIPTYLFLNLMLAEFLLVGLAVTLLYSSLFRNQLAAGGVALATLIGQSIASALPWIGRHLPGAVTGLGNQAVSQGNIHLSAAPFVGLGVIAAAAGGAWLLLRNKEL